MRVLRLLGSQPARAPPPLHVASLGLPINAAQSHASWQNPPRGPPQTSKGDERHWNPLASEARCRLYWDQRCLIKSRPASVMWTQLCLGGSALPSAKENPASSATSWLVTPSLWFRSRSLSVSAHGSAGQRGWGGTERHTSWELPGTHCWTPCLSVQEAERDRALVTQRLASACSCRPNRCVTAFSYLLAGSTATRLTGPQGISQGGHSQPALGTCQFPYGS